MAFPIGFRVETDPEFPPDGGESPERIPPSLSRIGGVLRLTAPDAAPWDIAIGAPNWWRAPVATWIAVISDGTGYLADVVERRIVYRVPLTVRIAEDERHDLVLFATAEGLTAVGADGVEWEQPGPWVDVKVERIERDAIVCSVYDRSAHRPEIRIDPRDGSLL